MNATLLQLIRSADRTPWAGGFALLACGLLLTGCPADTASPPASGTAGKVVIRGSNTIGEELAPRLIAEFQQDHADIGFDLEAKATGYGMAALRAGQCDIAAASRAAIPEELELDKASGVEMNETIIGTYSVALVVNAANPVADLTRDQVHDIFTGRVTNWKDVGGPDAAINLYIRDPISGTHLGFKELAMRNEAYATHPHVLTNYAGIVEAVVADPHGIGYSGVAMAEVSGAKLLAIGGVAPTVTNINSGKYPYARPLRFYTNKARESQATREFIAFVLSKRGQELLTRLGYTPKS